MNSTSRPIAARGEPDGLESYHLLLQLPNPILLLKGEACIITLINQPLLDIWGRTREAVQDKSYFEVFPARRSGLEGELFRQVLETGEPVVRPEVEVPVQRNGQPDTEIHKIVLTPVRDSAGKVVGILCAGYDITSEVQLRQNAEERERLLQQTKDQLDVAINAGRVGVAHWDVQQNIITWSREQEAIYGLEEGEFDGTMEHFIQFILPEDMPAIQEANEKAITEKTDYKVQFRIRRKDGAIRWVESRSRNLYNEAGELVYVTGTNTDITEQTEAARQLELREAQFRSTFENAAVGIAHVGLDGNWLAVNDRLCQIVGYTRDELLRSSFQEITHPDDLHTDLEYLHDVLKGKRATYSLEKRYFHKNGALIWINLTVALMCHPDGSPAYFISVVEDISARKKAEEALRESENRFRLIAETLPQMVWMADANGKPEYSSKQWERYSGLPTLQPGNWQKILHPDDQPMVAEKWAAAWAKGEGFVYEARLRHHSGQYRWHHCYAFPIRDAEGVIIKWLGADADIHDQKLFAEYLEQKVAERTRELQQANSELLRSNEYLQQFAYVASHDLQEPLRKIQSFGDILEARYGELVGEDGRTLLSRMQAASQRMSELVRDLLTYSQLTTRQRPFRSVSLRQVVDGVLSDQELRIRELAAQVELAPLPEIHGDEMQMQQLFGNLIGNALKYVLPGVRPHVAIACEPVAFADIPAEVLHSSLVSPDAHEDQHTQTFYRISVTDNGIGFEEKYLDRIFQMFSRLVGKTQYEGSGMGLAICKRVVDNHHGYITAHSRPGEGSTFVIYLPV